VYFHPQNNEMPSTEQEIIKRSKTENEGRRFWFFNFSACWNAACRVAKWMVHVCVLVYVIVAVKFWKVTGEEV
jgi:hypothetical protein